MIDSREALLQAIVDGLQPRWLKFWGHRARRPGQIDASVLSQWWPAAFNVDGERFATAEHFMMAAKARLFGDSATRARILQAKSPGAAKALGREVMNFDEERWVQARFEIVVQANLAKFGQHQALKAFLLETGDKILVEASPVDRIWGIGLAKDDPRAEDPRQWLGLNLLGFALMVVRERLKAAP